MSGQGLTDAGTLIVRGSIRFGSATVVSGGTLELLGKAAASYTIDSGGTLEIGSGFVLSGYTVNNGVTLDVLNGGVAIDAVVSSGGVVDVFSGGALEISSNGLLDIQSGGSVSGAITFEGHGGELQIDGPQTSGDLLPGVTISGFVPGDTIDLSGIANVDGSHADMDYATNVLMITEGDQTLTIDFDPNQVFTGETFHLASDHDGAGPGTLITETPCYCPGTLIMTARGQEPVEKLGIGERVMTMSGLAQPIKWIGRRSYAGRFIMGRKDVLPVCIKAGALDENVPRRDLWIPPHHAMYLEGVLIEAKDLVNGVSIVQAEGVDSVDYFHVELDSHDVIVAEGALSESFIDDDSRGMFQNAHEYDALYAGEGRRPARYCAPRLDGGYEVETVKDSASRCAPDHFAPASTVRQAALCAAISTSLARMRSPVGPRIRLIRKRRCVSTSMSTASRSGRFWPIAIARTSSGQASGAASTASGSRIRRMRALVRDGRGAPLARRRVAEAVEHGGPPRYRRKRADGRRAHSAGPLRRKKAPGDRPRLSSSRPKSDQYFAMTGPPKR